MERLIDQAARRDGHRPHRAAPAQPHHAGRNSLQDGSSDNSTTAAIFPPCSSTRSRLADVKGFAKRKRESKKRGKLRGLGVGSFLEVTAPPAKELGGIRVRGRRHRHDPHRHARFRPGPRDAVRAGAERASSASRSTRSASCRATATSCSLGGGTGGSKSMMNQRHRHRRRRREGDRAGQADRLASCSKPRPATSSSHSGRFVDRRHRPRRSGSWSSPTSCAAA